MKVFGKTTLTWLVLSLALPLFNQCEREANLKGSVSGQIRLTDAEQPSLSIPFENVMVYLLDADQIELRNLDFFLDSTTTDGAGEYEFTGLSTGNYAVYPQTELTGYIYEPTSDSDSVFFTIDDKQQNFRVDFESTNPAPDNDQFTIRLKAINMDTPSIIFGDYKYVIERMYLENIFETKYQLVATVANLSLQELQDVTLGFEYGYSVFFWSLTNTFRITTYEQGTALPAGTIELPLMNCPASSSWIVNWDTGVITRE